MAIVLDRKYPGAGRAIIRDDCIPKDPEALRKNREHAEKVANRVYSEIVMRMYEEEKAKQDGDVDIEARVIDRIHREIIEPWKHKWRN